MLNESTFTVELMDLFLIAAPLLVAVVAFFLSRKVSHDLSKNHWNSDHWLKY